MPNVKILLNEKIDKLGEVGEIVSVKPGYARNFLLPQRLATLPSVGEIKRLQKKRELLEKQYQEEKIKAEEIVKKLNEIGQLIIYANAGEAGKLFGRVTAKEITEKVNEEVGIKIERKQVQLKKPISEIGEYQIKLKLHSEVVTEVKIVIKNHE
ncbi:MAG: 50S ribosomal protein L9 [Candidatus Melainabacteria bacterium]|nr:50S ribosomal protein L9 [Candidatus Melainabacteria bacterium]